MAFLPQLSQGWIPYTQIMGDRPHTVVGDLLVAPHIWSPQLHNWRDLYVWLPPSYHQTVQRYPVIYMHDGQNLFDAGLSYAGEWQVDETMTTLAPEGMEAIVVGIANTGDQRMTEYGALDPEGRADRYLSFLVQLVKPLIDRQFRTRTEAPNTTILGSSLGGLISLYAFFRYPAVFGQVGALSPSIWFHQRAIMRYVEQSERSDGRIYLDVGSHEGRKLEESSVRSMMRDARLLRTLLKQRGYRVVRDWDRAAGGRGLLFYHEDRKGYHNEACWARRLPNALRFLLRSEVREDIRL